MRMTELPLICEVKCEYISSRQNGKSRAEATREILGNYIQELTTGRDHDGLLVWIGLADGQFYHKELTLEVAEKALDALCGLEYSDFGVTEGDIERRRINYAKAPMSERRVGKPKPKFRCKWSIGDTFAYQLSGPIAEKKGLDGKYALLRKVDELEFGDGSLYPVVTITIWDDQALPCNSAEFQRRPMLKISNGRLGMPVSRYEYRVEMIIKSNRQLAALSLKYLGNFDDVQMPTDEAIVRHPGEILMLIPEYLDRDCCAYWNCHNYYMMQ